MEIKPYLPLCRAVQLARAVHPRFVFRRETDSPRMIWKATIDMSRPAVPSQGNLDAYDGYVTYRIVQAVAGDRNALSGEIADMRKMVEKRYPR